MKTVRSVFVVIPKCIFASQVKTPIGVVPVDMVMVIVEHLAIILILVENLSKSEICNNAWKENFVFVLQK
jgi:hypothetical protein